MKNSASIAISNHYDIIHFINYDFILNNPLVLKKHSEQLTSYDSYFYKFGETSFKSSLFSIKTDKLFFLFNEINSKIDWCRKGDPILETRIFNLLNEKNISFYCDDFEEIKNGNKIDLIHLDNIYGSYNIDEGNVRMFLSTFEEKYFIFVSANNVEPDVMLNIQSGEVNYSVEVGLSPKFIEIPQEILRDGILVNFSKLEINKLFNLESNISKCEIKNLDLIHRII